MEPDRIKHSSAYADEGTGDLDVLVRRSGEDLAHFDSTAIVEALVREANLDPELASQIGAEVRRFIQKLGFRALNSSLIRGLVDAKLLELGLEEAHGSHTRLGVPLFDVDRMIRNQRGGAELPARDPEATSLMMAEAIKREYAIKAVFSEQTSNAHLIGDIHIHNIGAVDRPHSITCSVEQIKQLGLELPGGAIARPARRADVLIAHLARMSSALQACLAGTLRWDSVNFAIAPLLSGIDYGVIKQFAQTLIFELSTSTVSSPVQSAIIELHVDWDVPPHLKTRAAIGAGGRVTNRSYEECSGEAHRFLQAILEVMIEGDARGRPFLAPALVLHIGPRFNEIPGYRFILEMAGKMAAERGGLAIAFDRDDNAAFFSRYGLSEGGRTGSASAHHWQSANFQAVSLNLARAGYIAGGNQVKVIEELTRLMEIAAQAHLEKRVFLEKLLAHGKKGPLAVLTTRIGDEPILKLNWCTHSISVTGLNELCRCVMGADLHKSDDSMQFAMKLLSHLRYEAERLSKKHNVLFHMSGDSSQATAHRLAQLDLRFFGQVAADIVCGNGMPGASYYTDGPRLASDGDVAVLDRVRAEGAFQTLGFWNAFGEVFLGPSQNDEDVGRLISQAFYQTSCSMLLFCPEFTVCGDCGFYARGLQEVCPACTSTHVDGLAYGGGRYGYVSSWDVARRLELQRRKRVT